MQHRCALRCSTSHCRTLGHIWNPSLVANRSLKSGEQHKIIEDEPMENVMKGVRVYLLSTVLVRHFRDIRSLQSLPSEGISDSQKKTDHVPDQSV